MTFSSCLLYGLGISGFSTGLYLLLNDNIDEEKKIKDRNSIFIITLIVSILILFITGGNSKSIVPLTINNASKATMNNMPPF